MPFITDNEWTIIEPSTMTSNNTTETPSVPAEPTIEVTLNPKAEPEVVDEVKPKVTECTCDASMPRLARRDSVDSINSIDADYYAPRPPRRGRQHYAQRYPQPGPPPPPMHMAAPMSVTDEVPLLTSSMTLLDKVGSFDGIVDMPSPSRKSLYLTTYPFTQADVTRWSWLFSLGVEETYLEERGDGDNGPLSIHPTRVSNNMPYYGNSPNIDLPSVYLSRALDKKIVIEDAENVKFLVVVENRYRRSGYKLLVAQSRKAAGIIMYYEALKGESIRFVGAAVGMGKKGVHPKKFRYVETVDASVKAQEEGLVGVIC